MSEDGVWKRGGSYGSRRGGGRGGRGGRRGRGRGRGASNPLSRVEDEDGDSYMEEPQDYGHGRSR